MKYAPTKIRTANVTAIPPTTFRANPARNRWRTKSDPAKVMTSPTTILIKPLIKIRIAPANEKAKPNIALLGVELSCWAVDCCKKIDLLKIPVSKR